VVLSDTAERLLSELAGCPSVVGVCAIETEVASRMKIGERIALITDFDMV